MALFKICRGNESNLPETLTDGYAYFCTDTGNFYIDWADAEANVSRKHINSEYATKLRFKDENEEWVEIDPKDLHDMLGFKQVQADWEQNDPTSASYIANRPFGYLPNLYEDTWNFPEDSAQNGVYRISGSYPFPDECALGETYDVVWNGVQYSCAYQGSTLTKKDGSSKLSIYHLGNIQLLLDGLYTDWTADTVENDAPFVIIPTWRGSTTPGACHVVIRHDEANNYSKLDEKFLPDSAATKEFVEEKMAGISVEQVQVDWNETDPMSPSYIVNRPFGLLPNLYEDLNANFIVGNGTGEAFIQETKPSIDWDLIKTGNTYIVVWDGFQYTCEATMASYVYDASGGGTISFVALGNPKLLARYQGGMSTSAEDPYKPFLIALSGVYSEKSGSHSYYIQSEVNFKKLDIEYLPDGAATTEYVDNSIDGLANVAKTGAYQSLSDAPRLTRVAAGGAFDDLYGRPFGDLHAPMAEVSWTFTQHEDTGLASRTIRVTDESGFRTYPLPVVDAKYTVSWDGENYTCTAKQRPSGLVLGHEGDMYFGNIDYFYRVFGGVVPEEYKTAEPFCFYYMNGDIARADSTILVITDLSESSHTFSIVPQDDVKKIDIKYLPDGLATEQFVEDKIANIKVSGGGTVEQQVDLIPEQEIGIFYPNEEYAGYYYFEYAHTSLDSKLTSLSVGDICTIVWDGQDYTCVVGDSSVVVPDTLFLGNGSFANLSGNGEPFGIAWDAAGVTFLAVDESTEESHTIRVYQTKVSSVGGVSSWNDLTDKPFYEADVVVFEGEFQGTKYDSDGDGVMDAWEDMMFAPYNNEDPLVVGQTYTFYWDGVKYTSECYSLMGVGAIGFNAITSEGMSAYPVAMGLDIGGMMTGGTPAWIAMHAIAPTDMSHSGLHSCKIIAQETKKIDDKYQHQPDWDETDVNRASFVKNKPFGVLSKAGVLYESDVSYEANDFGFMLMDFASEDVIIGGNYKVSVNGVDYTGVCEGAGSLDDGAITYTHLVRLNADGQATLGLVCNPTLVEVGVTIPATLAPENLLGDTRWGNGEVCHIVISAMDEIVATVPHKYLDFIESHEDIVIPKMDVEFISQGGESGAIISTTEDEILRVAKRNGEYINVEFDGVVYKSKIISDGNDIGFGAIGVLAGVGSTSEPFVIIAEAPLDSSDPVCQWIIMDIDGTLNGLETPYTKSIKVWFDTQATVKNEFLPMMDKSGGAGTISVNADSLTENFSVDALSCTLWKVSDEVLTEDQLFASTLTFDLSNGSVYTFNPSSSNVLAKSAEMLITQTYSNETDTVSNGLCICYEAGDASITIQDVTASASIPSVGTYLVFPSAMTSISGTFPGATWVIDYSTEEKWTIKEEYLPEIHAEPAELPYFNLIEMGLPNIPIDGSQISIECDTSAIREAVDSSTVKVTVSVAGVTMTGVGGFIYTHEHDNYTYSQVAVVDGVPAVVSVYVTATHIAGQITPLGGGVTVTMTDVSQEGA